MFVLLVLLHCLLLPVHFSIFLCRPGDQMVLGVVPCWCADGAGFDRVAGPRSFCRFAVVSTVCSLDFV